MSFISMTMSPDFSSMPPVIPSPPRAPQLRTIPGSYGWPLLGPISDRLDYFWFQGPDTFFKNRIEKYQSTVFRTNIPPSFPLFLRVNPNVVAVLDCKSFAYLFDMDIVEKKNILIGDFMPSVKFTGDYRVCAYLDTTEPAHGRLKNFAMDILKQSSKIWVTELTSNLDTMWDTIETNISQSGTASYLVPLQQFIFKFLSKALTGADPANSPEIEEKGYAMLDKWLALQLLPTVKIGILQPLEEIFLHSFAYPFQLVKNDYKKLYDFIKKEGKKVLNRGETEFGLSPEETIHNLLFLLGFNAFGGFSVFLPSLLGKLASDSGELQAKIRKEVRENGELPLSFDSVKEMELVKSFVYETLRVNPPVPLQFGRARKDFELSSHDSVFGIKKGELLCGYQAVVMQDPKVFDEPEIFKPDRFMGKGSELLSYLYWSNGRQTDSPNELNKQCAAKDYVVLTACLFVAYLFRRYESFTGDASSITAVEKRK